MDTNGTTATAAEEPASEKDGKIRDLLTTIPIMERLCFASEPIRRTYSQFRVPIYLRIPGCYLAAPYGSGKTIAMDFCAAAIRAEVPGLPVFVVDEQVIPKFELRSFFVRALIESKHDGSLTSKTDTLRNRLVRYWAELSHASPLHCVVLLLDEGQAMRETDEALLKDLVNGIAREGGSLQIFVFGESPAFELLVAQKKAKPNGAQDRLFGGHRVPLSTYESAGDWASLFSEMDTQRFDKLGGKTVVEAFFSHMDFSGFLMKDEAKRFYAVLNALKKKDGIGTFNLRRIFVGIRHALFTTCVGSVHNETKIFTGISKEQWTESLRFACGSTR